MTVVMEKRRRTRIVFLFIFDFSVEIDRNERSSDVGVEESRNVLDPDFRVSD